MDRHLGIARRVHTDRSTYQNSSEFSGSRLSEQRQNSRFISKQQRFFGHSYHNSVEFTGTLRLKQRQFFGQSYHNSGEFTGKRVSKRRRFFGQFYHGSGEFTGNLNRKEVSFRAALLEQRTAFIIRTEARGEKCRKTWNLSQDELVDLTRLETKCCTTWQCFHLSHSLAPCTALCSLKMCTLVQHTD